MTDPTTNLTPEQQEIVEDAFAYTPAAFLALIHELDRRLTERTRERDAAVEQNIEYATRDRPHLIRQLSGETRRANGATAERDAAVKRAEEHAAAADYLLERFTWEATADPTTRRARIEDVLSHCPRASDLATARDARALREAAARIEEGTQTDDDDDATDNRYLRGFDDGLRSAADQLRRLADAKAGKEAGRG